MGWSIDIWYEYTVCVFHSYRYLDANEELKSLVDLIEVGENEIVLMFQNNIFQNVLTVGRYMFWKGITKFTFTKIVPI